jgi:hypothetical protein
VKASRVTPFRLYDLRHTWATRAAMSGIDLVTLASMLRHSRIRMVLRYAHPTQDHQTKAMEPKTDTANSLRTAGGIPRTFPVAYLKTTRHKNAIKEASMGFHELRALVPLSHSERRHKSDRTAA